MAKKDGQEAHLPNPSACRRERGNHRVRDGPRGESESDSVARLFPRKPDS